MKKKLCDLTLEECNTICKNHTCSNCPLYNDKNSFPLCCYKDFKEVLNNIEAFNDMKDKEIDL